MQHTLKYFSAEARHDIKKCRGDAKKQRVITKRKEQDIIFNTRTAGLPLTSSHISRSPGNSEQIP